MMYVIYKVAVNLLKDSGTLYTYSSRFKLLRLEVLLQSSFCKKGLPYCKILFPNSPKY